MNCSSKLWFTLFVLGILFLLVGDSLVPSQAASWLIILGFLFLISIVVGKMVPWLFFYEENRRSRSSRRSYEHPERLPIVSRFPNGDFLVAVKEKRLRMWITDTDEVYCQEISVETGHAAGSRISGAAQASSVGIPAEIYKRLEKALRSESKFM